MNTIFVSGTAKMNGNRVIYNVHIWGSKSGEPLQFVRAWDNVVLGGYTDMWRAAKTRAMDYFGDGSFEDGAHTQYLDHIILQ